MITYCTNIHPGESWDEIFAQVKTHSPAVKNAVAPDQPFPIGLRLSNRAAAELDSKAARLFQEWCRANDCFIPTLNGFPFSSFHQTPVKERVYLPDWRSPERASYTRRLADLLDLWLPDGLTGSISTVPVGFQNSGVRSQDSAVRKNLINVLEHLDDLRQRSGKVIILALEPEPGCVLETTAEVVRFFEQLDLPVGLRAGLGICLDCCHQAIQFEEPAAVIKLLNDSGISIAKVQISSALCLTAPDRATLEQFCEPIYLHQTVIRKPDNRLLRYNDLAEALADYQEHGRDEWRIHFHLPVFIDKIGAVATTQFFIKDLLPLLPKEVLLEVETYTWDVLPAALQLADCTRSIIREIEWLKNQVRRTG